jgi:hypothetical protein
MQRSVSIIRNGEQLKESTMGEKLNMQKFDTEAPVSVVLDVPAGRIQFIAADRADATAEVRPANPSKGRDVKTAEQTTVEFRDGVLRIVTPQDNHRLLGTASGSLEVTVQLPAGSRVDAKAALAEFRGVGRLGDVTIEGAQGTVKLDETAAATLTLQAGDITVGRLAGPAHLNTRKGDIHITEAVHGTHTLHTDAGNLTIDTDGRINNTLTNNGTPQLTIHATTSYGDITARTARTL